MKKLLLVLPLSMLLFACGGDKEEGDESEEGGTDDAPAQTTEEEEEEIVEEETITYESKLGTQMVLAIGTTDFETTVKFYTTLGWSEYDLGHPMHEGTSVLFDGSLMLLVNQLGEGEEPYIGPGYMNESPEAAWALIEEGAEAGDLTLMMDMPDPANAEERYGLIFYNEDGFGAACTKELLTQDMPEWKNVASMMPDMNFDAIEYPNEVCGTFQEFALNVENLKDAMARVEKFGFVGKEMNFGYPYAVMYDGLLALGLHEAGDSWGEGKLSISYSGQSAEANHAAVQALKDAGFEGIMTMEEAMAENESDMEMPESMEGMSMDGYYIIMEPSGVEGAVFYLGLDFSPASIEMMKSGMGGTEEPS